MSKNDCNQLWLYTFFILELVDEAQVSFVEHPHIVNVMAEHCDAVNAHAECEALIAAGVNAGAGEYLPVHHAAAEYFQPFAVA